MPVRTRLDQANLNIDGEACVRLKFTSIYPHGLYDGRSHSVVLTDSSSGEAFYSEEKTFRNLQLQGRSGRKLVGGVHFVSKSGHVEGWILDKSQPQRPIAIDLLVDGQRVAREYAHLTSPNMLVGGEERHGFRIQVPNAYIDGSEHRFEVVADGVVLPAIDDKLSVKVQDHTHQIDGIALFYARFDSVGFEYLRGVIKTESRNFASLALYVGETPVSRTRIEQSLHQGMVDVRLKIPDDVYDGKRKTLSVRVDTPRGQTVVFSTTRIMPLRLVEQARVFDLAIRDGRLNGKVVIENEWAIEGAIGLFVGDVRVASHEFPSRPGDWGEPAGFSFDLATLSAMPWLQAGVSVALVQAGAQRLDVSRALLEAIAVSVDADVLKITTAVPLTGAIKVGISRSGARERVVEVECLRSETIVQALSRSEAADTPDLQISLDGRPIGGAGRATKSAPAAAQVQVAQSVDPGERAVRDVMEAISFGTPAKASILQKGKASGAWELAPPHRIVGWAIDLESPSRVLSVSVYVDGKEFGPYPANKSTRVAQDLAIDRGFEIDLTRVDIAPGLKNFEIRFYNSKVRLSPAISAQLIFPGRSEAANRIDAIDQLVDSRGVEDALALSVTNPDKDPGLALRYLVLGAALRRDWLGYDQIVDRVGALLDAETRVAVKRLKPIVASGDLAGLETEISKLDLPRSYAAAVSTRMLEARSEPSEAFAESYARWTAIAQPRPRASSSGATAQRIVVLDLSGGEASGSPAADLPWRFVSAPARAALSAGDALDGAVADELRAAAREAEWALVIARPRLVPRNVLPLWGSLASSYGACDVTVIPRDLRPGVSPARELDRWSALVPTGSFEHLVEAARAAMAGKAHGLREDDGSSSARGELTLLAGEPGAASAMSASGVRCLCLHDFPDKRRLPTLPPGVLMHRSDWSPQGGLPTPAQIADAARKEGEAWAGAVVVLSRRISYPDDYLFDCIRHYERSAEGVAFHGLAYDRLAAKFVYDPHPHFDETSSALLPLGCFPLSVLTDGQAVGGLGELRIVQAPKPFHVVRLDGFPKDDERDEIVSDLVEGCSPSEHQAGFASALRERHHSAFWRFQGLIAPLKLPGINDDLRARAEKLGLRPIIERLERGQVAEAQDAFRLFVERQDFLDEDAEPSLKLALALVRLTGQQDELMGLLLPNLPRLVDRHPGLLVELFENAAFVLQPDELAAAVIGCSSVVLDSEETSPIAELLEIARRYCGEKIMIILLSLIDQSEKSNILFEPEIKRTVGAVFASDLGPKFRLTRTKLGNRDFEFFAPNEIRLITSLLEGRRSDFLQVLNDMISTSPNLLKLARLLRTYTNELEQFKIRGRDVAYPSSRSLDEVLQLALILGDVERVSGHMAGQAAPEFGAQAQVDPLRIVWSSVQQDYAALNEALRVWYAPHDIRPVSLAGAETSAVFASVFEGHAMPKAESAGRVSVICTVFNPDIELLNVSIGSMLAQTYDDIEIILLDDASDPEFAPGILETSKRDPRIRYLRTSRNGGPYQGRNLALEIATGEFFAIQDGDDIAHPQRLEFQVRTLTREPTYKMATSGHLRIDTRGQVQFEHTLDLIGDGTMTSIFRRSLFDQVGGFAQVRSRGDVEFRERVRRAFGDHVISHTPVPLLFCLASPGSLSNQTAARFGSYLALYRDGFAKRVVRSFIDAEPCGSADAPLSIPYPLRPTTPR